ncbi:hypothetical protein D9V28_11990 [Mycetocola zhadangensis]|uniref:Glycosyltransferase n=2 Tax=Mycetocola zhadangensis TaxID=1164595 RepID=A0A3L7IX36_9MICO|nr:hypothetical protein D9V28_11990 [Mycetocola zhadangensis]
MRPDAVFAGVKTALEVACTIAQEASLPLRLISLGDAVRPSDRPAMARYLNEEFRFDSDFTMIGGTQLVKSEVGTDDLWLATHWTTAHSIDVACRLGLISNARVIYLIQDYEPGFYPWSTQFALARSTYHAGFTSLVNSTLLAHYLRDEESVDIDPESVFGPSLDLTRLRSSSETRKPSAVPRLFFYARPSKPRNLFDIGVSALTLVAQELERRGIDATFVSAGEQHADVELSSTHRLHSLGKLVWGEYFDILATSDIVLSLQHSPHPSHPPLDAVCSGAIAVTNELGGTRAGLDERLFVAQPEPQALANEILRAIDTTMSAPPAPFSEKVLSGLGGPLPAAVRHVLRGVEESYTSTRGCGNSK